MIKDELNRGMIDCDWQSIAERIESELVAIVGLRRYRTWFEGTVQFELRSATDQQVNGQQASVLQLSVGSTIQRDCLQKQFAEEIREACRRAGIPETRLAFHIEQPTSSQTPASQSSLSVSPQQKKHAETPASGPTPPPASEKPKASAFDSLIVGSSNRAAISLAQQIAAGQPVASPLLVWGATGVGKTALLHAIRDETRRLNRRIRAVYLTGEQFTTGFVEAVHGRGLPAFRNKHRGVQLLLLDDLQFFARKQKTLEELQHTLDALIAAGAQVVIASDRSPSQLSALGSDITSRVSGGVNVEILQPNYEMRLALLQQLADKHQLELQPMVLEILAAGILGGPRELGGAINRLKMESQLLGKAIGQELTQQVVDQLNRQTVPEVRMRDIQSAICETYDIDSATLKSGKRTKAATEPRMLAMWLSRKYTRAALSEIGDYYGRRSHSTVISACHRVDQLIGPNSPTAGSQMQEALRRVEATLRMA